MTTFDTTKVIHERLRDLSDALELEGTDPFDLLICGGAALAVMGFVARATDDIDVLAFVHDEVDVAAKPFPDQLVDAIERVARARGIPAGWLNPGPADMQQFGLPAGLVGRAKVQSYGPLLTVRFLARYDQIHLKLYAAIDQSGGKHLSDLKQLEPTTDELSDAASWCVTQDPSPGFRASMNWFLEQEGYDDVVDRIS